MIRYSSSFGHLKLTDFQGFCADWPVPLSPHSLLKVLEASSHAIVAIEEPSGKVVGFITALSDGILSAYISMLEVLPDFKSQGIGSELIRQMLEEYRNLYMVDLLCDAESVPFYERFGLVPLQGMALRRYERLKFLSDADPPKI